MRAPVALQVTTNLHIVISGNTHQFRALAPALIALRATIAKLRVPGQHSVMMVTTQEPATTTVINVRPVCHA